MDEPIFFVHFSNSWYLESVIKCATHFNNNIIFLGDEENEYLFKKYDITFDYYKNYGKGTEFEYLLNSYKHIGTAPQHAIPKHHFNFLRWFRIYDYMNQYHIPSAWYFDSDTLICRNLADINIYYKEYGLYTINRISGCAMKINSLRLLKYLCYLMYVLKRDNEFVNEHTRIMRDKQVEGKHYNLCDMTIIRELWKRESSRIGELSNIINESMFDPNLNIKTSDQIPDYPYEFAMKNRIKEIHWNDNIPYFEYMDLIEDLYKINTIPKAIRTNSLNCSWFNNRKKIFKKYLKELGVK